MATTFIDVGLITGAQFIFAFIIVWVIVYSMLTWQKIFDMPQNLRGLLALLAALLTLASPKVLAVVSLTVPWFSIIFVFITLILLGIMIFGIPMKDITTWVSDTHNNSTMYFVIIVSIIIFAAGLGYVFFSGSDAGTTATTTTTGTAVTTTTTTSPTQTVITSQGTTTTGNVGGTGSGALLATIFHPKVLGAIFVLLLGLFTVLLLVK